MELLLSWGYALAAIASLMAALKTGQYSLLLGIPISVAALLIVSMASIVRNVLETASKDAAVPAPIRLIARFLTTFSFALVILWPVTLCVLLFSNHFVGAWLVGTYVFASNTIRWYRVKYLPSYPFISETNVVPGQTGAALEGLKAGIVKRRARP